jgi:hypothetical protein
MPTATAQSNQFWDNDGDQVLAVPTKEPFGMDTDSLLPKPFNQPTSANAQRVHNPMIPNSTIVTQKIRSVGLNRRDGKSMLGFAKRSFVKRNQALAASQKLGSGRRFRNPVRALS